MSLIALVLLACGSPEPTPLTGDSATPRPLALSADASPSTWIPSVLHVRWQAPQGAISQVNWGLSQTKLDASTPETGDIDVDLAILGLPADTPIFWQAVSSIDGIEHRSEITAVTVAAPDRVPSLTVLTTEASAILPQGYLMGSVTTGFGAGSDALTRIAIWRASDGVLVWWFSVDTGWVSISPSLSPHAAEVVFEQLNAAAEANAQVVRVSIDGMSSTAEDIAGAHHVAVETEAQKWAWIGYEVAERGDRVDYTDQVLTADFDGTATPTLLHDQATQLYNQTPPNTCVHNTFPSSLAGLNNVYEWTHSNSLIYVPESDALYLYGRFVDSLWKIDRSSGDLLWQLGGPNGDFTHPNGDPLWTSASESALWSHAHLTEVWEGGALLFDNGDHATPKVSGVVEVSWDEANRTAEEVWRYASPNGDFISIVGDARRLPDDHVLISWTTEGQITEVDRAGNLLWKAQLPGSLQMARVRYIPDLYDLGAAR